MQRIRLTKSLLTELDRCDRSFILSSFWHGLDNESLEHKGGISVDTASVYEKRREMIYNMQGIAESLARANGIPTPVICESNDIQEKLDNTWALIEQGGPVVIVDGALEGSDMIVGFSVLVIDENGYWEVYHQASKTADTSTASAYHKSYDSALRDAAPLMYVLAENYSDYVKRFAVIAANKKYLTPYPDPETMEIKVDANEAMMMLDLDIMNEDISDYLFDEDPIGHIDYLQSELAKNPFWIPEAEMGSHCKNPYVCPFYTYCYQEKENNCPNSVFFYLPSNDAKKLESNGYPTMDDMLELSYDYPSMEDIPTSDGTSTFTVSDIALRELRAYEQQLLDVEDEVAAQIN